MLNHPILIIDTETGEWELNDLVHPPMRNYKSEFISFPIVALDEPEDITLYIKKLQKLIKFLQTNVKEYQALLPKKGKK